LLRNADEIARVLNGIGDASDAFGLIHGDLHFGNVVFSTNGIHAIDFDDCGFGYWVYDIATTMRPWRFSSNWGTYWAAFQRGYARIAPLPPGADRLDLFILARHLATILWASSRASTNAELAQSLNARCDAAVAAIVDLAGGQYSGGKDRSPAGSCQLVSQEA
jgi:Ser/Thr protein kinase RdoA (MazF antagonist)